MSAQNMLKKPAFAKAVMGYSTAEVDKYIDHIIERYNSVCAESAELKRRVIRLQMALDEANGKLSDAEELACDKKPLDRSALYEVFDILDAEKKRTEDFYENLKATLNKISEEKSIVSDDSDWEEVLNGFIESVGDTHTAAIEEEPQPKEAEDLAEIPEIGADTAAAIGAFIADFESFVMADDDAEETEETEEAVEVEEVFTADEADETADEISLPAAEGPSEEEQILASDETEEPSRDTSYEDETEMLLKLLQGTFYTDEAEERTFDHDLGAEFAADGDEESSEEDGDPLAAIDFFTEEEAKEYLEEAKTKDFESKEDAHEKTPAEIAAELDFYTDSVYRNGESFDPMTLAHNATSKRKPTLDDFFSTEYKPYKNK